MLLAIQWQLVLFLSFVFFASVAVIIVVIKYTCCVRPSPQEILLKYPVSYAVEDDGDARLNAALVELVKEQILRGVRLGSQIAAFHKGRQIVNVFGMSLSFIPFFFYFRIWFIVFQFPYVELYRPFFSDC
jgi:hypothetical protein